MKGFYEINKRLSDYFRTDPIINTVSSGGLDKIAQMKVDMYPIAHVIFNSATIQGHMVTYNTSVVLMDLVEVSKEPFQVIYEGNDNEQDVIHQMQEVAFHFYDHLRRGVLHDTYDIITDEDATMGIEYFSDRFADKVAGVTLTIDIKMAVQSTIC